MNTITVIKEETMNLSSFEAWSGGKVVLERVLLLDNCDEVLDHLTVAINDSELTDETSINDFLWFEADRYLENYLEIDIWA